MRQKNENRHLEGIKPILGSGSGNKRKRSIEEYERILNERVNKEKDKKKRDIERKKRLENRDAIREEAALERSKRRKIDKAYNNDRNNIKGTEQVESSTDEAAPLKGKEEVSLTDQEFKKKIEDTKTLAKTLNKNFVYNYTKVKDEISIIHKNVIQRLETDIEMSDQAKTYYDKVCQTHTSSSLYNRSGNRETNKKNFRDAVQDYLNFVEECNISDHGTNKAMQELLRQLKDLPDSKEGLFAKVLARRLKRETQDGIEIPIIENYEGKRFLLIATGGTIGSVTSDTGTMKPQLGDDANAAKLLLDNFHDKYGNSIHFDTENIPPTLSENLTLPKKLKLVKEIIKIYQEKGSQYDGIFITNGSDTLAYTISLESMVLPKIKNEKGAPVPTFVVSANKPLDHPQSNGLENLKFAVDTCVSVNTLPSAVFTIENWKVPGEGDVVCGARTTQCKPVRDTYGSLSGNDESGKVSTSPFARIADGTITILDKSLYEKLQERASQEKELVDDDGIESLTDRFLKLESLTNRVHYQKEPQSGLNYHVFDPKEFDVFIQGPYHGGTACTEGNEENFLKFARKCRSEGVQVILGPLYGAADRNVYGSTEDIDNEGIPIIMNITHEALLEKVRLAYSLYPVNRENKTNEAKIQEKRMEIILEDVSYEWVLSGKKLKRKGIGGAGAGSSTAIEIEA